MRVLYCLAAFTITAHAADSCRKCHAAEYESQSASAHAAALSRVTAPLPTGTLTRGPYRFEITGTHVRIADGKDVMDLPLEWAFGAGRQAITYVTRVNQDWYVEHFASWYTLIKSYGPTPGHDTVQPKTIAEAAGLLYRIADPQHGIKGCFECHSTGAVSFDATGNVTIGETGIRCESCHAGAAAHASDPPHHKPANPAKLTPAALNDFCGKCHRPPAAKNEIIDWNFAWNVRHQPVYLSQSRCFLKSTKLSCLTCHDPHEAATTKPVAFFNGKCLDCHKGCVTPDHTNCIDCHMPRVSPQAPLRFTNHWIGVYRTGAKLRPVR